MVKLVAAKCPSCGAQLKLDDNLKRTECKYCNTTIIVDEAIENYKIEVKGKVSVDGIKGSNSYIEEAKKDLKLKNYDSASLNCSTVIKEHDKYSNEAYIILLKITIEKIKELEDFENKIKESNTEAWCLLEDLEQGDKALKTVIKVNDSGDYVNKAIGKDRELIDEVLKYRETYNDKIPFLEGTNSHDTEIAIEKELYRFTQFFDDKIKKLYLNKLFEVNFRHADINYDIRYNKIIYNDIDSNKSGEVLLSEKFKTPVKLYNALVSEYDNMTNLAKEYDKLNQKLHDFLTWKDNYKLIEEKSNYLKRKLHINLSQVRKLSEVKVDLDTIKYEYFDYDSEIMHGFTDNNLSIEEIDKIIDDFGGNSFEGYHGKSTVLKYISYAVRIIILLLMWMYILSDIGKSFSKPDLLTPVAALVYIGIGLVVSVCIWRLIGKIFIFIQRKTIK